MGLTALMAGLAAAEPVPVFAIAGSGMRAAVQALRLDPGLRIVDSPRAAAVLLIAGLLFWVAGLLGELAARRGAPSTAHSSTSACPASKAGHRAASC